jgi:hypothetical protein
MDLGIEILAENDEKKKKKTMYLIFKNTQERNFVYENLLKFVNKNCITTENNIEIYTN